MKRYTLLGLSAVLAAPIAFQGSGVLLQSSTPGTAQTGHSNITGTAIAGTFKATNITPTGVTYAADFRNSSTSGRGIHAWATATSGATYSGLFQNSSTSGRAVTGLALATSGVNYGIFGRTASPDGFAGYFDGKTAVNGLLSATNFSGSGSGLTGVNAAYLGGLPSQAYLKEIPVPLSLTAGYATLPTFRSEVVNGMYAIYASATQASNGASYGVYSRSFSTQGIGVYGDAMSNSGPNAGVYGRTASPTGRGVFGESMAGSGVTTGVYGRVSSSQGIGVFGVTTAADGTSNGVRGDANNGTGVLGNGRIGVEGVGAADSAGVSGKGYYGVKGLSTAGGAGVFGDGGTVASSIGVRGSGLLYGGRFEANAGDTRGVYSSVESDSGTSYAVYGAKLGTGDGYGLYALGDSGASGLKTFRIDDPTAPTERYIQHYSSESPMPQNFYCGNVKTDAKGYAWVELPAYFESINANVKYLLTVVDDADLDGFVMAKVSKKVQGNRFQIRTSAPNVEVSWEIKADRNDPYTRRRQPKDVVPKIGKERGKYQDPTLYGVSPELGVNFESAKRGTQ